MTLAIISHTEHFKNSDGNIVGWGPTVREINFLASHFEHIYHLACYYTAEAPKSAIAYTEKNIEFIPLPPFGGRSFFNKLTVITRAPQIIKKVNDIIGKVDAVQLRIPTGMGNYLLPYFTINKPKAKLWVKYAGNWADKKAPLGYKFQKWWLQKNYLRCPVTINGKWPDQSAHCLSFENPCIDEKEQILGSELIKIKQYDNPLTGIFVGRMETWKGVDRIIESFPELFKKGMKTFHFVGGGDKLNYYRELVLKMDCQMQVIFHDYLKRENISKLLVESHVILLPSDNEGFPKVIAEAANYGCVPVVSGVSSIPHYINDKNGFLWDIKKKSFSEFVESIDLAEKNLSGKAQNIFEMSKLFTFKKYNTGILNLLETYKKY